MNTERPDHPEHDDADGFAGKRRAGEEQRTGAASEGVEETTVETESPADGPAADAKTESPAEVATESPSTEGAPTAEDDAGAPAEDGPAAEAPAGDGAAAESPAEGGPAAESPTESTAAAEAPAESGAAAEAPAESGAAAEAPDEDGAAAEASGEGAFRGVGGPGAEVTAVGEGGGEEMPGRSRRRSPVVIASVAAAVLLLGGGGAYLAAASGGSGGRTGSGVPGDDGTTPPPLALDGYSAGGGTNGIAPGEPNPYGVTYQVRGSLPDGPDAASVYRAAGEVTRDEVARLAKSLGLDGTPVARGQSWQVGPAKDGSGPSLVVDKQAPGAWTFHRYAAGTNACKSTLACTQDPANPADDTVTEAAAKKAAAPVLKAIGQDDAKRDASQVMGAQRVVNADPVVGGLPTYGWTTGLTIGAGGDVVGGSGQLKAPAKGDTYPVLGARRTLDLLNAAPTTDHRMGIGGCASPVPLKDRLEAPCGQSSASGSPGATATPSRQTAAVESAVFGLATHTVNGRKALVPSWLFQVRGAGAQGVFTVTYPAVDPKYLGSADTSSPSATATSAPRDVTVDRYTAVGTNLTVSFTGGVCADYKATADEGADEVTVTVTETPWPDKVCIMIAKEYTKVLPLKKPLGDRTVVGSDGKEIPRGKPGARLPGPYAAQ
ncbi:ICP22 family protein [Streptomyces sp. 7R007]